MAVIFVDADACPVRSEAERVAVRHNLRLYIVSNGGIRPSANPLIETVFVAEGADAADDWIAERCGPGDVVVTADIPLADRCIRSGSETVKPDGSVLDARSIGAALSQRNLMTDLRSADPFRQGGGKAFSQRDRSRFLNALEGAVRRAKGA